MRPCRPQCALSPDRWPLDASPCPLGQPSRVRSRIEPLERINPETALRNHSDMGTNDPERQAFYENRYRSLGYLFYSIAACERSRIQPEIDTLKELLALHWMVVDRDFSDRTAKQGSLIDSTYDLAEKQQMMPEAAFALFNGAFIHAAHCLDPWARSILISIAGRIARLDCSAEQTAQARIGHLRTLFGMASD